MNDLIPFYEHADRLTCTATAAVTGKRFVRISGNKQADGTLSVATAGNAGRAFGVSAWDTAINKRVTVVTVESGDVVPVTAAGVIPADSPVTADAQGRARVAVAGELASGTCLTGAVDGADAMIKLSRYRV